jgi:hypothetical protein
MAHVCDDDDDDDDDVCGGQICGWRGRKAVRCLVARNERLHYELLLGRDADEVHATHSRKKRAHTDGTIWAERRRAGAWPINRGSRVVGRGAGAAVETAAEPEAEAEGDQDTGTGAMSAVTASGCVSAVAACVLQRTLGSPRARWRRQG